MYLSSKASRTRQSKAQKANRAEIVRALSIGQITRRDLKALSHEGGTPKPTLPDPTNYPSGTPEKLEKLEKDGAFLGVSPLSKFPFRPQGARKLAGSHTLGDTDNLRLGGNRSRAPPPVA